MVHGRIQLWKHLVVLHEVRGVQVHDTRLVAYMLAHQLTHILTWNGSDFQRFANITVIEPQSLLQKAGA